MDELSIEEKAKRYDEAIEKLRQFYRDYDTVSCLIDVKEELANLFPELTESEDEEVRKVLYEYFKNRKNDGDIDETWYGISYDKILNWLEKQGEDDKKGYSVWVGGFEINDYNLSKEEAEKLAEEYKKDGYDDVIVEKQGEQKPEEIVNLHDYLYGEQKPTDKVEPMFHIGNRVRYKGHKCDGIITEITDTDYICGKSKLPISTQDKLELVNQKPAWSEEDLYKIENALFGTYAVDVATRLLNKIKSIKDRVQQKPAWSEEDEEMCKEVLADIIYAKNDLKAKECLGLSKRAMKAFNWFSKRYKSLRPQNTWKPSDLPRWKKSTLPNDNTTGFNSDYFHYKGYNINYKELFEKLPKDE